MPGEPTDPDHATSTAMGEHEAHLKENLQSSGDRRRGTFVESLRTIATLQEETLPLRGLRHLIPESVDLPTRHERRKTPQAGDRGGQGHWIRVHRLLGGRRGPPNTGIPTFGGLKRQG